MVENHVPDCTLCPHNAWLLNPWHSFCPCSCDHKAKHDQLGQWLTWAFARYRQLTRKEKPCPAGKPQS
jgi:hypothetical protein